MRPKSWANWASFRQRGQGAVGLVGDQPKIDVAAIDAIEAVTKHDVIAFLDWVAQQVGPEARFMHQGMTSSDVLDTTLSVQLGAGLRHPARRHRRAARRDQAPRDGAQVHAHHRPQPRHPCRADHFRQEAGRGLCRVRPAARRAWSRRAPKSRPARFRARSALLPTSIPRSRNTSPKSWAWRSSRSPPRSSRAIATRCSSRRWA
jgi:hypothetical protein